MGCGCVNFIMTGLSPAIGALFFMKIFFRMLDQHGAAEGSRFWFFGTLNFGSALLIFMNEVYVQSKKQKIKSKEVGDSTDPVFHRDGFVDFGWTKIYL